MKGDVMLEVKENLADILSKGEELQLAKDLYAHAEKIGRAKFTKFIKGELNPNAELLTPDLIYLLMFAAQKTLQSQNASKRASAPRKKDDQKAAFDLWAKWQKDPSLYENKQQYISGVMRKCKVAQNTARTWFDEFRARPSPEPLLMPWLHSQDLCMVYAGRGIGKTHFALSAAYAVATGGKFMDWQATLNHPGASASNKECTPPASIYSGMGLSG